MWKSAMRGLAFVMFVSWVSTVGASTTVYTDKAAWAEALDGLFLTENFTDDELNVGVSYVSAESGHINPAEDCYQDVLMSTSNNEPQTVWSFGPAITAYGGNWTLGGPGGSGNRLLVYLEGVPAAVGSISNSYDGEFWGFISDTPFTSVKLIGGTGSHQQNYRLDDMTYAPYPGPALPGDLNGDGTIGSADLDIVRSNWGEFVLPGDLIAGDVSGDGMVDSADLDTVRSVWGTTSAAAIPEPSVFLLGFIWVGLSMRRRRR